MCQFQGFPAGTLSSGGTIVETNGGVPRVQTIREATWPDDLPVLRRLMDEYLLEFDPTSDPRLIWDESYIAACEAAAAAGTLKVLLAADDATAIGFTILRVESMWYRPSLRVGDFEEVYVRAEYRCRGLAGRMIALGTDWFDRQGVQTCSASVIEDNPQALSFWRNRGFDVRVHRLFKG